MICCEFINTRGPRGRDSHVYQTVSPGRLWLFTLGAECHGETLAFRALWDRVINPDFKFQSVSRGQFYPSKACLSRKWKNNSNKTLRLAEGTLSNFNVGIETTQRKRNWTPCVCVCQCVYHAHVVYIYLCSSEMACKSECKIVWMGCSVFVGRKLTFWDLNTK